MPNKITAHAQSPLFLYRLLYRDPIFDLEKLDDKAVSAAYAAFRPWNVSLENITFKDNPANLGEEATNFNLLGGRIIFSINAGGCGLLVANPSWSDVDWISKIAAAGIEAILRSTGAEAERQFGSLTMHLTPATGTIQENTSHFLRIDTNRLPGGPIQSFGFSVYRDDFTWVVDKSAFFPNSLFLRMERFFSPDSSFEQIAGRLHEDEEIVFDLLGLKVD